MPFELIAKAFTVMALCPQHTFKILTKRPQRMLEYFKQYGITAERIRKCKKDIVVMHPGPINRGIEMSSEVADGKNSVILEQVTNGIAVRMAVLYLVAYAKEAA